METPESDKALPHCRNEASEQDDETTPQSAAPTAPLTRGAWKDGRNGTVWAGGNAIRDRRLGRTALSVSRIAFPTAHTNLKNDFNDILQ